MTPKPIKVYQLLSTQSAMTLRLVLLTRADFIRENYRDTETFETQMAYIRTLMHELGIDPEGLLRP